jgi:hypothetical protein
MPQQKPFLPLQASMMMTSHVALHYLGELGFFEVDYFVGGKTNCLDEAMWVQVEQMQRALDPDCFPDLLFTPER